MRILFIGSLILCASMINAQADYKANFLKKWANAAAYTIECAENMPEELYDYKPTDESRTFKEQLLHMIGNMMWLSTSYLEGPEHAYDLKDTSISKENMLSLLKETFTLSTQAVENFPSERMSEVVDFFAGPMEIQQIMMLMTDHMTHHRGQILVYLRMNEVKAPKYRGW